MTKLLWDVFWTLCALIGFLVVLVLTLSMLAVVASLSWFAAVVSIILAASIVWTLRIIKHPRRVK